jgi:hypothetical protein
MKKNRIILAVTVSLFILVGSCRTDSEEPLFKANKVEFDTLVVEKRQYLHSDTVGPFCDLNVHFVYPNRSEKADLKRLQEHFIRNTFGQPYDDFAPEEAIDRYTKDFLQNYQADAQIFQTKFQELENHPNLLPQNLDSSQEKELQSNEFYTYIETLSSKIHFNKNNLLSFQVCRTNSKGGSATYSAYNNYVVNLETGDLVTENDLFVAGYDVALQQLFATKLLQQNNVSSVYDLEELGYFGIDEIMPNRNFLIDEEGITYIFNKGEYSAYLLDAPEVFIPFNDLRMLLKKHTLVTELAEQLK